MNIQEIKNHKVGSILQFAIPSTIGMVLSCMITITDGFFTGNFIGSGGLAAVNLGLPVLYLYLAVGLMIGVGGSVICGIENGSGNHKKANEVFNQSMILSLLVSVGISLLFGLFFNPVMKLLKVPAELCPLFKDYYSVFLIFCPLMVLDSVFGMFLRADGKPQVYMMINILTVILNAVLDYVFAAKLGFGIKGIAFASLGTLLLSVIFCSLYFLRTGKSNQAECGLKFGIFSWNKEEIAKTFLNGSSEFIGELAGCISMYCYNFVLLKYSGQDGVAAFTILGYSIFIFSMITIGFGEGMCPLVSFCFGAKEENLCRDLRKITNRFIFVFGVIFAAGLFFGAEIYARIFVKEGQVIGMVTHGLKIFVPVFLLQGFNMIGSMYFTSCGMAKESAIISAARGIVILLITIFVFSALWGLDGIWLTAPVTEAITLGISMYFISRKVHLV
ncbi:MAG: MATE family efflux transporter [Treponema sp.]|nr:MATE family efflux transporter [Treponema sp.]